MLALGIAATIASILALAVLDARDGPQLPIPAVREQVAATLGRRFVTGILLVWLFVGANTADDGYQVTVGRVARTPVTWTTTGTSSAPQDPFGWHYHYLSMWMQVSTATPWLRLLPFIFARWRHGG